MDSISHAALGAATAQLLLFKHVKHNAWLVGALWGFQFFTGQPRAHFVEFIRLESTKQLLQN